MWERRGTFKIRADLTRRWPETVQKIMAQCAILRCEYLAIYDWYEYHAISNHFQVTPDGAVIPEYVWELDPIANAVTAKLY